MGRYRYGAALAVLLASGALAATQGPPVYVYTGTAPSGACAGDRVWIDALGTGTYYCNAGTWTAASSGGGAPTNAQYWVGAPDGTLSAEKDLSALSTGIVVNNAGTPQIMGAAACTLPNVVTGYSATGVATCGQPSNVSGNAATATALAADPTDCSAGQYATAIAANGNLTCSTPSASTTDNITPVTPPTGGGACSPSGKVVIDTTGKWWTCDAGTWLSTAWGSVESALHLAANGTNCTAGQAAAGVDTYGNAEGCFAPTATPSNTYWEATGTAATSGAPLQSSGTFRNTASGWSTTDSLAVPQDFRLQFVPTARTATTGLITAGDWQLLNYDASIAAKINMTGRFVRNDGTQSALGVTMTQDRTVNATTATSTTDLVWPITANEGQSFTCNLTSTSTATSKIRYAVAGPASMTYVNCRVQLGTTSLTTIVGNTIQAQWASTCTGCTNSVTASVLTSKITDVLSCSVTNGANAGNITIYFADSTAGQVNTLHKGSGCRIVRGE